METKYKKINECIYRKGLRDEATLGIVPNKTSGYEVILCIYANMIEHEHVNSLEEAKKILDKLYNKHKGVIKK